MALEGLVIKDKDSIQRVEDIWMVHQTLADGNSKANNHTPARSANGFFSGWLEYG
jgi:hypothetical protein